MKQIRVLIVDDSPTIRHLLAAILSRDPMIDVVGEAPEPATAREMIKTLNPDVLTLDVEMPGMNGLEFLEKLMRLRPMPVVMISTLTERGTDVTLDALALGAVDYVPKPNHNVAFCLDAMADDLIAKVKAAANARVRSAAPRTAPILSAPRESFPRRLIAIGASTGGVEALIEVLSGFPANCPPTVITQHMPAGFTRSFAARLDKLSAPQVQEAYDDAVLEPGQVYLAPGGSTHLEITGRSAWRCKLVYDAPTSGHRPSVDRLFHSVARTAGARGLGVILTGMGRDGALGLCAMRQAGAQTIGQDEASAVVYGMPCAAFEQGAVMQQHPLHAIGGEILKLCREAQPVEA